MKILFTCLSQSWGGMEMYTLSLIDQLLKKGLTVDLLCYPDSRVHQTAVEKRTNTKTIKTSGYFHPIQTWRLTQILKTENYSLIHTHASKDLWVIVPALSLINSKIPLIMTKHLESFVTKKDLLHRLLYKRVNKVTAISNLIKNNLLETTPIPEEKVVLIHNGLDLNKFDPQKSNPGLVRKEFGISPDEIVIGMLARFTIGKGHEEFLSAAKELNKRYNNLKFLIVGEPSRGEDEYADKIKKLAIKGKLDKNLIFTGFRSDTADVLSAMDIFGFPSHSEAFGMALIEAMAMGKPSVCSDSHGILDIAIDGVTSLLFKRKNAKELEYKLEELIISEKKREQLGANARIRVLQNFDFNIIVDETINLYKNELS